MIIELHQRRIVQDNLFEYVDEIIVDKTLLIFQPNFKLPKSFFHKIQRVSIKKNASIILNWEEWTTSFLNHYWNCTNLHIYIFFLKKVRDNFLKKQSKHQSPYTMWQYFASIDPDIAWFIYMYYLKWRCFCLHRNENFDFN